MLDYQSIVEEIQAALLAQGTLDWDLLRDTAAEYSAACEEVNERLAECQRLLKQGLRSEAIQAAEREPNVLDGVALLDFPEAQQWHQLLATNGHVAPPTLRIDVAMDLNAAYAAEAPLQSLLKKHRLFALGRAHLPARIQVLREIRLGDITNPVWTDDLRLLETVRHQELQKELESAVQKRDLTRVSGLVHEFMDNGWVYPPQPKLVMQAEEKRQRLAAALAAEEMQRIENELSNAHTALDAEAGRIARAKWNGCQQVAGLSDGHALAQRAAPALLWLASEDDRKQRNNYFATALALLESGLESDSSRPQLERLFHSVRRFDEEIPLRIVRRYEERIRSLDTAARRRFTLFTTVGVVALLLVAGGIAWVVYRGQREEAVIAAAQGMARLVDAKSTAEAQRFYDDLYRKDPSLASRTEIQQEVGRLNGLVYAEKNRRASFESMLTRAIEAGLDAPDRSSMIEAEKVALTLDEKSRAADWHARVSARDRERQRERDGRFQEEFDRLLTEVEGIEKKMETLAGVEPSHINDLLANIEALQSGSVAVTKQLASQATPLRLRVVALSRQLIEARSQQQSLNRMSAAVGNADTYRIALETFVKQHTASPLAAEFQRVVEEVLWCKSMLRWNDLLAHPRFADLGRLNPKDAKELLARAQPLLAEAGELPLAKVFKARQPFLQTVADRVDERGISKAESLKTVFNDSLIRGLWMVQTKSGQCYYIIRKDKVTSAGSGGGFNVMAIAGFDLSEQRQYVAPDNFQPAELSPQAKLAKLADPLLNGIQEGDWDAGFLGLIQLIVDGKELEQLDPILRFILLRRVLEVAKQGSHSLDVGFQATWAELENARLDLTANWLQWNDAATDRAREQARNALNAIESQGKQRQKAGEIWRTDTAALPPLPQWVGWLRPVGSNAWKCEGPMPLPGAGNLFVLAPDTVSVEKSPAWRRIAGYDGQRYQWETSNEGRFLAGRPVFLVIRSSTPMAPSVAGSK